MHKPCTDSSFNVTELCFDPSYVDLKAIRAKGRKIAFICYNMCFLWAWISSLLVSINSTSNPAQKLERARKTDV